ncbi:hypothetical protein EUA06_09720 [Nocardioides glacieisoli]|uniref:DUF4402 domain-containing protein n=1 Tax=Nocardioides glacieisoli TaxID=1168730 RepID=A0A4Q2RUN3_9ACTN|nr:hypothetical protein [Nocardioides glacieisoli]RYB91575.1 hypothetical protein EUA06_09720 [Nocardioides glacieisoli]
MTGIKPDRRQVIRAGAWTVPAIAVATAAPAFAASAANMSTSSGTFVVRNNNFIDSSNVVLRNTGSGTTSGLSILITVTAGVDASGHTAPGGWTITVIGTNQVRFIAPLNGQIDAGVNLPVTFSIRRLNTNGGTISGAIDVASPGVDGALTSLVYT